MIIKDQICLPGKSIRPNEDIGGYSLDQHMAWVIDGATGLTSTPLIADKDSSDAQWFSHTAQKILLEVLQENVVPKDDKPKIYIINILSETLTRMISIFENNKTRKPKGNFEEPCASFSLVYVPEESDKIHCFILGDTPIIIKNKNSHNVILGDPKHAALDVISCEHAKPYLAKGLSFLEMREELKDILHKHRNMMNTEEGYWIFSLTLECLKHIRHYSFSRQQTKNILIMSDGFYALVDKYNRYTDKSLIEKSNELGLESLYKELRIIENDEDPKCKKYLRLKQSDDATAILLSLSL